MMPMSDIHAEHNGFSKLCLSKRRLGLTSEELMPEEVAARVLQDRITV